MSYIWHLRKKREGDELEAGEFTGRITEVVDGQVREVVLRFRKPLGSDSYRFYWCDPAGRPIPWVLPPVEGEGSGIAPTQPGTARPIRG